MRITWKALLIAWGVLTVTGMVTEDATAAPDRPLRGFTLNALNPLLKVQSGADIDSAMQETLAQINAIADLGGTIVRFPCLFYVNPNAQLWLAMADRAQRVCEQRGVTLAIDFAVPPDYFCYEGRVRAFADTWGSFAIAFAPRRGRIWFELLNEPARQWVGIDNPRRVVLWRDAALAAATELRRYDTRHAIAFAPHGTTTDQMTDVTPLPGITNQVLTCHFYDFAVRGDGRTGRGDVQFFDPAWPFVYVPYPSSGRTAADLRQRLQRVADAGKRYGLPVYISEVAIYRQHANAPRFLRDFTDIADELGINVTVHSYREADCWNYENTPAWSVLANWLSRQ